MRSRFILSSLILVLSSSTSYASKSRLAALQFADFWRDSQNVFQYTQYASDLGQYVTLELGPTGTFSTGTHAEGGFARKFADGVAGIYVGHQSWLLNGIYSAAGLTEQSNPLFLYYSSGHTGYGLNFSYQHIKSTGAKEITVGGAFGTRIGSVDLGSILTLYSKSDTAATNTKVFPALELNANMAAGKLNWYSAGNIARTDAAGATAVNWGLKIGTQDHAFRLGTNGVFFYGTEARYNKTGTTKTFNLPIYAGLETDLASWAVIRGALSQSIVNLVDTGSTDVNTNNTLVTLGGTVKTGDFSLDGLLAAGTTGAVNATTFMTSAAVNYKF